jgi:branched-chain amino acid aminotransferase
MQARKIFLNGKLIPAGKATIPVSHKGVFYDFGVYDSIKVLSGFSFYPEWHVERLFSSADALGVKISFSEGEVLSALEKIVKQNKISEGTVKIVAYGGEEEPLLAIYPVGLTFYPGSTYTKGVSAITFPAERRFPNVKSVDLLQSYLALKKATEAGAFESLLVDSQGVVREGSRTNLFFVKEGKLFTTPRNLVLEGITRKIVCGLANVEEAELKKDDLPDCDEIFITATSMGVVPVVRIDGRPVGEGCVGPVARDLHLKYRQFVRSWLDKKRNK